MDTLSYGIQGPSVMLASNSGLIRDISQQPSSSLLFPSQGPSFAGDRHNVTIMGEPSSIRIPSFQNNSLNGQETSEHQELRHYPNSTLLALKTMVS